MPVVVLHEAFKEWLVVPVAPAAARMQ